MKKPFRLLLCLALLFVSGCSGYQKTIRFGAADIGGIYYTFANTFTGLPPRRMIPISLKLRQPQALLPI